MKKRIVKRLPKPIISIAETRHNTQKSLKTLKKIYTSIAEKSELNPSSTEVQLLIEKCRTHISEHYYDCDIDMFKELGKLYVTDDRFKENFNSYKPGFAEFLSKAIDIYCITK